MISGGCEPGTSCPDSVQGPRVTSITGDLPYRAGRAGGRRAARLCVAPSFVIAANTSLPMRTRRYGHIYRDIHGYTYIFMHFPFAVTIF